jgi:hypothetical protein
VADLLTLRDFFLREGFEAGEQEPKDLAMRARIAKKIGKLAENAR